LTTTDESSSPWRSLRRIVFSRLRVLFLVCLTTTFLAHLLLFLAPRGIEAADHASGPVIGYLQWLWKLCALDLGVTGRGIPVSSALAGGLAVTVPLLVGATLVSTTVAIIPVLIRLSGRFRFFGLGLGELVMVVSFFPAVLMGYFTVLFWIDRFVSCPFGKDA